MNANDQNPTANDSTERSFRLRFSLRSLLLVTALVSIACWAIPASIRWKEYREIQHHIESAKLQFHKNSALYAFPFRERQYFFSPNGLVIDGKKAFYQRRPADIASDALFITPPNVWVTSKAELMKVLDNDPREEDKTGVLQLTTPDGEEESILNQSKLNK